MDSNSLNFKKLSQRDNHPWMKPKHDGKTSKITPIKAIKRTKLVTTITELNAESYQMLKESWNICHSSGQAEVSWSH